MFGKTKQTAKFDINRELGRLVDEARESKLSWYLIAEALERHCDAIRQRQATTGMHSGAVGYRG